MKEAVTLHPGDKDYTLTQSTIFTSWKATCPEELKPIKIVPSFYQMDGDNIEELMKASIINTLMPIIAQLEIENGNNDYSQALKKSLEKLFPNFWPK
jgi:hypothetical protein